MTYASQELKQTRSKIKHESLYQLISVSYGDVDFMVEIKGRKFTVILREEPEGGYSAQCVELPGAISQGENRKQALANIREAIEGYLEAFPKELPFKCYL
jgi:predicted RNase H-like HicB family nuclease